jgi:hypothetical protein
MEIDMDQLDVNKPAAAEAANPEDHEHHPEHHEHQHEVVLDIATPKGPFRGVFPKTTTIAEVIDVVVDAKKLDKKDTFELVHGDTVLQPVNRTLGSFGLHGVVKLELVATGSGV